MTTAGVAAQGHEERASEAGLEARGEEARDHRPPAARRRLDGAERLGIGVLAFFFFAITAAPLVISFVVSPEDLESGAVVLTPPCPTLVATGVGCPSCGLTRGFCSMSRLRLDDATRYNAAAPWLYLGCLVVALGTGAVLVALLRDARRASR